MKMIKTFSREKLYEEIWEISAKQVSLKYDLRTEKKQTKIKIKILLNLIQLV